MSNIPSSTTKVVAFRLSNEVYDIAERRAEKHPRYKTVNEYLKNRVIYDTLREHKRKGE